jgi:sensor histidine kinase YesM
MFCSIFQNWPLHPVNKPLYLKFVAALFMITFFCGSINSKFIAMKNLLTFLLITIFSFRCISEETEKLPEIPWANIVEMNLVDNVSKTNWQSDIYVKLQGLYKKEDSIIVSEAIRQLDSLTETISIQFSPYSRGNLEIFIIDTTLFLNCTGYYVSTTSQPVSLSQNITSIANSDELYGRVFTTIFIVRGKEKNYEAYLKNSIARALVSGGLVSKYSGGQIAKNRNSIFSPYWLVDDGIANIHDLNELDKAIIRETYKKGYAEKLELAKKQFKSPFDLKVWLRNFNPYIVFLLPAGVIILLLLPFFMKVTRIVSQKFQHKLLRFNISGLVGSTLLILITSMYSILAHRFKFGHVTYPTFFEAFSIFLTSLVIMMLAINLIRFVEILVHRNTHLVATKLVLIFLSTVLIPFCVLLAFFGLVSKGNFSMEEFKTISYFFLGLLLIAGFRALISYFFFKEKDLILENETKLSKLRELKSKAELNALHSRINPHFLYNSLNSIAGLAHVNANQTEHMALSLSKLFRYSINKEQSDWTTLKEELEMVKIYLDVEKVRFEERLVYSVEIAKELEEQQIPRFIIQPLAENAVKHGISKLVEGGEIKVNITKEGSSILIAVADTGTPFDSDFAPGFGLQSIYDKLEILYADKFEMNFENTPQKRVTLKLRQL